MRNGVTKGSEKKPPKPSEGRLFCGFFVPLGTLCNLLAINVCALCV